MGIPLRPFKQTPKSPTSVVDALPPVFTTHEELHKGSRREAHQQSLQHSQHQQQSLQPPHRTASLPQPHGNKVGPDTTGPAGGGSGSATPAATAIHKKTGLLPPTVPNRPTSSTVTSPAAVTTVPPGLSGPNHAHTNGTSSTALWIASANAAAAATRTSRGHSSQAVGALESVSSTSSASSRRQQQHQTLTGRTGSDRSLGKHSSGTNHTLESYYEEEILEDDDDEGDFFEVDSEDDDAMLKGGEITVDEDGDDVDLNLFPERNPTIRFDEYDEMQTVLHINDYTKHEIHRAWYRREDYDKMVQLARKTAEKAEQRKKELEEYQKQHEVLQKQVPSSKAGDDNGGSDGGDDDHDDDDGGRHRLDSNENRQDRGNDGKDKITTANGKEKMKKPIEYRGLEAWTASGAAKVKLLKESAIELVWNEQSRQWDAGQFNPEAIREVYLAVSRTAQQAAWDRGMSDALIVERLRELEEAEAEKKRRRKILGKSKALFTKSVRLTGKGVKKTGQLVHKTTKVTTKVAKEATKRSVKAGVATATLDPRMMKEALKVSLKKRECKHEVIRKPSQSHIQEHKEETDHDADDGSVGAEQSNKSLVEQQQQHQQQEQSQQRRQQFPSQREASDQSLGAEQQPQIDQSMTTADESFDQDSGPAGGTAKPPSINTKDGKAKKSKLKLLGVVPIPGTKKVYKEDRREKKAEKRIQKQARRPAWEANVSTGKY